MPATVEYKDGQTVWLQLPISLVKERYEAKVKEQEEKQAKEDKERLRKKKIKTKKKEEEFMNKQRI